MVFHCFGGSSDLVATQCSLGQLPSMRMSFNCRSSVLSIYSKFDNIYKLILSLVMRCKYKHKI